MNKKEDLAELLKELEDYIPIIPDSILNYYMMKTGTLCKDEQVKKLISVLLQQKIFEITKDALQFNILCNGSSSDIEKIVLSAEDISNALSERGINVKKPPYFV